jgi:hypothetical protein
MNELFEKIRNLQIKEITPPGYLTPSDITKFQTSKGKLEEIQRVLRKASIIAGSVDLPTPISNKLNEVFQEFLEHYNPLLADLSSKTTNEVAEHYRQAFEGINSYYNNFFEFTSSSFRLPILNVVSTYGNELMQGADEKTIELISTLEKEIERVKRLSKELDEKATQSVISNYAEVFEAEETNNQILSNKWLVASVVLSISFLTSLIFSIACNWMPIITTLTSTENTIISTKQIFNYPLLISKIVIISFIVYLITFCFKQYSINKHLQTVNKHRKNAINSYNLFEASLGKNDGTKNILMLELAKAIYELTHTGYLSKESDSSNNKFIEWTKMIDSNKTS